ncbi:Uncharacterized protein TCM_035250 [Theobroma cacao]|uniref:Uncharacterized protein n=1 Tax=Theobroma cacao TaxID=3641 RepID=A0A061FIE5_THECC|nr:Uncharacterized protein TCM_035250 [Theobroma cacao]
MKNPNNVTSTSPTGTFTKRVMEFSTKDQETQAYNYIMLFSTVEDAGLSSLPRARKPKRAAASFVFGTDSN